MPSSQVWFILERSEFGQVAVGYQGKGVAGVAAQQKPADVGGGDFNGSIDDGVEQGALVGDGGDGLADGEDGGQLAHPVLQLLVGLLKLLGQALALAPLTHLLEDAFYGRDYFSLAHGPDQVVVCAQAKSLDDVPFHAFGGQHDDRDLDPLGSERYQEVFPTQPRQVQVGQNGVRRRLQRLRNSGCRVAHDLHLVACGLKRLPPDQIADHRVALNNQDAVARFNHGYYDSTDTRKKGVG